MIDEMKSRIYELRKSGYGYKKIAKVLSLTPSAVRYVCNKMSDEELLNGRCENCGVKIRSIKGKKKKWFCSNQCRWDWWNNYNKKK